MYTGRRGQRRKERQERRKKKCIWAAILGAAALWCLFARLSGIMAPEGRGIAVDSRAVSRKDGAERALILEEDPRMSDAWQNIFAKEDCYPEALIEDLERNPEMLEFVEGYLTAGTEATGGLTEEEMQEDCPLMIQWDERWGYVPYGQSNIGISGCGPTCLAMVLFGLTRDPDLTPDVMAQLAMREGYYVSGEGTAWSFLLGAAPRYGVMPQQYAAWTKDMVRQYLEEGKRIIFSMGPGDFTEEGHFIVARGYENGKLRINDPFSYGNSEKEWEYDTIEDQSRQMWVYEKLRE